KCIFTSSNAKAFGLDQVYAGELRHDTIPPHVIACSAENTGSIRLKFDEPVVQSQGNSPVVLLGPPGLSCVVMQIDSVDASVVRITPPVPLSDTVLYTLDVCGFHDEAGNRMTDTVRMELFLLTDAVEGMVVISEIMSDPDDAPGLPSVEYLEIHNRSKAFLCMNGWTIADAASVSSIAGDTLRPGAFRVIASSSGAALLNQSGVQSISVAGSMPSLNNDGDLVVLTGSSGILDRVEYDPGMYRDPLRDDRGWSLERIDLDFTCHDRLNWKASTDSSGGTPGRNNSASGNYDDTQAPVVVHVFPESDSTVHVYFSENMDPGVLSHPVSYTLSPIGITPTATLVADGGKDVLIEFGAGTLQYGISYELHMNATLSDCPGNAIQGNLEFGFALPEPANRGDVIINEVLFNPKADDGDFVEVYNASDKALDLYELKLLGLDDGGWPVGSPISMGSGHRLLMPGQFAVAAVYPDRILARYSRSDPHVMLQVDLPSLPDDAGGVAILNRSLLELERFRYDDALHHPLISDPEGISLERIAARNPASDSDNWHSASSSAGYATPGYRNSQGGDAFNQVESSWFGLSARLFSPDNDGQGDLLQIHANWPAPGFMGRVAVFTEGGQLVREFGVHELSGTESDWFWDGNNRDGQSCAEGIYFLTARFLHISGQVLSAKTSCVIARRD
ncbi:MAG: lamin tail domain-containing protein, partial [Bacteroidota bacterium]